MPFLESKEVEDSFVVEDIMTDDWECELCMTFEAYTYKKVLRVPVVSFLLPYWHTFRIYNQDRIIELESVFLYYQR